jgi:broad specificity phosphatase PhoE
MTARPIRLFLIRHSKSCANFVRHAAETEDPAHPLVAASQTIRDPALTEVGRAMARAWSPRLHEILTDHGIAIDTAVIGASALGRARETAELLFPGRRVATIPHFTEHGRIPENTPRAGLRHSPDWPAFLKHIAHKYSDQRDFVVVGHGSYLRSEAWPAVSRRAHGRFHNLDGFIIEGAITPSGRLRVRRVHEIPYRAHVSPDGADRCPTLPVRVREKIVAHKRTMRRSTHMKRRKTAGRKQVRRRSIRRRRQTRKQTQRGGAATPMPLAYFQDGAQMRGTYAEPTGAGLAASSPAWIRQPMTQTSA